MDRRLFLSVPLAATAAGLTGALTGCGGSKSGSGKKIDIRLGDTIPDSNPEVLSERFFGTRVAALTNNKYDVKVFPNSTLGDTNRMNEQVRQGTLQATKTLMSNLTAFDKRLGVLSLPYAFPKQEDLFTALAGDMGKAINKILESYDFKVLAYFDSGARNVYNKKRAIHTPADLKGLRIRVPQDPIAIDIFNTLGAQATPLASNEVYSALQQGVVDGAENNPIQYVASKQVEEAKFFSWTRHQFGIDFVLMSKKWFDQQPAKMQDAFVQAGQDAQKDERDRWKTETDNYAKQAADKGAKLNDDVDMAAFQQAVKPVLDKNKSAFGDLLKYLPVS
jgi:tripartite ATP-independent transporter DctP family solute receptor